MVDAAASDLLATAPCTSSSDSPAKLSSAECCKINEDSGSQRCLSPVLNNNNSHRKLIYNRKRGRTKSRVRLTKRFSSAHDINREHDKIDSENVSGLFSEPENYINNSIIDIQNFKSDQVGDRLAKIREFDKEKKKILDSLYVPLETQTYVSDRKPDILSTSDEFNFKKPESPTSDAKKFTPFVDVLSQDRKAMHGLVTNGNRHLKKQDLNNPIESRQPNILEHVRNENVNIEVDSKFQGFCTGSGKNIKVSHESLKKNSNIFCDILDIYEVAVDDQNSKSYSDSYIKSTTKEKVFENFSRFKSEKIDNVQIVDKLELCNSEDVSFIQTSISDTQLILAADVALSMMDDSLLVAPSSTYKMGKLDSSNNKNNFNVVISPIKTIFKEKQGEETIEHEMIELEKILCTTVDIHPKIADNNSRNFNTKPKKLVNLNNVERNNQHLNAEGCVGHQILKDISTTCNEENNFKGFTVDEYNFAQQLHNDYSILIKKMENEIKCCSNLVVTKNKEKNIAEVVLETNQPISKVLQQTTDARIFDRNGKHALNNMCTIPSKRFKFDTPINDFIEFSECGFKTVSKKPIKMLPSSMNNAQRMYEQICQTDNTVEGDPVDNFKDNKKEIPLMNTSAPKIYSNTLGVPTTINNLVTSFENPKSDSIDFPDSGFKTASKKPIKMLSSSMKNAQRMYEQVCQTDNTVEGDPVDNFKDNKKEIPLMNTSVLKIHSNPLGVPTTINNLVTSFENPKSDSIDFPDSGFKTASKKPIKMLSSSMKNAQRMYEQVCQTDNTVEGVPVGTFKETKKEIPPTNTLEPKMYSETSLVSTTINNLMVSSFENPKSDSIDFSESGFKTASKKPIKMLPSSMKKAQHIYEQICKTKNPADCVQTETNKNIQLQDISLTDVQKKISNSGVIPRTSNNMTTAFKETKFDVNTTDFSYCGFKTASKKPIKMLPSLLKKAQCIFENIDMTENPTECNEINKNEFLKKSREKNVFNDASPAGFSTAGGKTIKVLDDAWQKASSVFANEEVSSSLIQNNEFDELIVNNETVGFNIKNSADRTVAKVSDISSSFGLVPTIINSSRKGIEEGENSSTCAAGFTTGSGMKIKISKNALQKSETLFADDFSSSMKCEEVKDLSETSTTVTHVPIVIGDDLQKANKECNEDRFLNQDNNEEQNPRSFSESYQGSAMSKVQNSSNSKPKFFESPRNSNRTSHAKKRLGLSACKQISISNDKLQKAKSILEEDLDNNPSGGSRNAGLNTPVRFKQAEIYSSTPLKEVGSFKNSDFEAEKESKITKANTLDNINITPVKKPCFTENFVKTKNLISGNNDKSAIIIQERIESNIKKRLEQFNNEYEDLKYKMKIILERKGTLELQEELIKNADDVHRRQKPGILLGKKQSSQKISLKKFCGNRKPGCVYVNEVIDLDMPKQVLEVTPKNAKYVHFNCNCKSDGEKYYSSLCTADGAVVIPNANNLISLTEISTAFAAMPGVDPRLLPKEWISNHFKWIVWKLASLQRNFPDLFPDWLSVENVVQQLKYRYDREIDRAERPALRKILENDDIPQKRMVLCVSDIIEVSNNMFELELTDGWYCIQTLIDQPLCKQIIASKIVIGTKLMVQCAEILNCDGCHPLEVPSNVRLKINYNCTRRAPWYSRLGYQRTVEWFPIPLRTINSDGGIISVVKIYIARVYPVRYMERQAGKTVWRNKKAEDKRAQEWANARMKEVEMIHQKVQEDYEKEMNNIQKNMMSKVDCNKISEISSPKLLYQMLENTNDPEGFKSMLSSSQITSAMEYRSNIYAHHQQEVASRIAEQVKNLKSSFRKVTSVLKLRIVDGSENSEDSYIFNIWKPTEEHLQLLKEGCQFSVYNILPKPNGDLSATSRTHFNSELPIPSRNNKLYRHILPISMIQQSVHKPLFNEYDTVGTVVKLHKDAHHQDLWLTDIVGRLLHVKILDGPEQCCLLDNLNRGQSIAVMNLIFRHPHNMFGQALANQCTVITGYPQHKFLQDGLTAYCKQLPKDLSSLLNECDKKIEVCMATMNVTRNTSSLVRSISTSRNVTDLFDDSSEDHTVIPSRLTTTDVAMSLIDTDQFL